LYDENGIYVEYRGLYECSYSRDIGVNIFIQNNSGKLLQYIVTDEYVNKASMDFRDRGFHKLHDGTMQMTKTQNIVLMKFDALTEWGFTTIQNIEFTIEFEELIEEVHRIDYCRIPVSLTLDYPIVSPK